MVLPEGNPEMQNRKLKKLASYITSELNELGYKGSMCMFFQSGTTNETLARHNTNDKFECESQCNSLQKRLKDNIKKLKEKKLPNKGVAPSSVARTVNSKSQKITKYFEMKHSKRKASFGDGKAVKKREKDVLSHGVNTALPIKRKSSIEKDTSEQDTMAVNKELFQIIAAFCKDLRNSQDNHLLKSELQDLRKQAKDIKKGEKITRLQIILFLKKMCSALSRCMELAPWNRKSIDGVNKFLGSLMNAKASDLKELVCEWCQLRESNIKRMSVLLGASVTNIFSQDKKLNILEKYNLLEEKMNQIALKRDVIRRKRKEHNVSLRRKKVSSARKESSAARAAELPSRNQDDHRVVMKKFPIVLKDNFFMEEEQNNDPPKVNRRRRLSRKPNNKRKSKRMVDRTSSQWVVEKIIQAFPEKKAFTSRDIESALKANEYDAKISSVSKVLSQLVQKEVIAKFGKRGRFFLYTRCVREKGRSCCNNDGGSNITPGGGHSSSGDELIQPNLLHDEKAELSDSVII